MSHAVLKRTSNEASHYNRSYGENAYNYEVMSYTHSSSTSENEIYENDTWYGTNNSNWSTPLPIDMQFNDGHRLQIAVYRSDLIELTIINHDGDDFDLQRIDDHFCHRKHNSVGASYQKTAQITFSNRYDVNPFSYSRFIGK